ncbi:hypothetical protein TIFTF001_046656 [Ficus carica]|uniref:Uncharacterized protein n=1 Tax=Ficus carica TaxID=3494 RepID=A0AA87ZJ44_FICCA|nr:hypothetical protein TIFTF001_046656 [Ficus carica]
MGRRQRLDWQRMVQLAIGQGQASCSAKSMGKLGWLAAMLELAPPAAGLESWSNWSQVVDRRCLLWRLLGIVLQLLPNFAAALLWQSHSISIQIAPQFLPNFAAALLWQSRSKITRI